MSKENLSIPENIKDISSTFFVEKEFKFISEGFVLYKKFFMEINSSVLKPLIVRSFKLKQFSNVLIIDVICASLLEIIITELNADTSLNI